MCVFVCVRARVRVCVCMYTHGAGDSSVLMEKIYRFEFPERPGALKLFLDNVTWNVTLFHYRSHGSE